MIRVAINGATGRMGREVVHEAAGVAKVHRAFARSKLGDDVGLIHGAGVLGTAIEPLGDSLAERLAGVDVLIDFSLSEPAARVFAAARAAGCPIVSGTTGLDERAQRALDEAAEVVPVLWAPNFSQGVVLLEHLGRLAAQATEFDIEVVETHHRHKRDAPSGTAMHLAHALREARGGGTLVHGRTGPRAADSIGMHALRGGSVVGDHTLVFAGEGERIELTHRADERAIFARGALRAARWIVGQAPGPYTMADAMGLAS